MNSSTGSESKNHNSIDSTKKRYEIAPHRSEMENIGLQDGVGVNVMLPASTLNQYTNTEHNDEHHDLWRNGNIETTNS